MSLASNEVTISYGKQSIVCSKEEMEGMMDFVRCWANLILESPLPPTFTQFLAKRKKLALDIANMVEYEHE